jgi:hypothetical protein
MDAEDWLRDTERKLNIVGCSDDEKLRYATYYLVDQQQLGRKTY